ncbi:hypothetical protein [Planktothricoides raciborskii]|uniref:Uncharacterized protein n=1 Tax=Planktothricoides raciborskii GIHE-MW2 TaxID=2792601 RepID=A0AAU8JLD7_9CYAN
MPPNQKYAEKPGFLLADNKSAIAPGEKPGFFRPALSPNQKYAEKPGFLLADNKSAIASSSRNPVSWLIWVELVMINSSI